MESKNQEQEKQSNQLEEFLNHENLLQQEIQLMKEKEGMQIIPHLSELSEQKDFKVFNSPLLSTNQFNKLYGGSGTIPQQTFTYPLTTVRQNIFEGPYASKEDVYFLKGGPRKHIYFNPKEVIACIVTCGGLCPGLNVVIREITHTLIKNYDVKKVYGIQYGYRGFYKYNWQELDIKTTNYIHKKGGTILGSSRGGFDAFKIIKNIKKYKVNQIYLIGGDGTQRGAEVLFKQIQNEKLNISIVGLPKTIDNDISIIDRSFGYQTSVDEAIRAINSGESEALSAEYGVGLIKLMGRSSGHIALEASLSQRGVDILLVPEVKYELYGKYGLLNYIFRFLVEKHKCLIVVAEGAGDSMIDFELKNKGTDQSGNVKFADIGVFLKTEIVKYCSEQGLDITLKYIDPTYMIRSTCSNPFDTSLCASLAYQAVHGAMSGFTGFCVGKINNRSCYIPLNIITKSISKIKPERNQWQRMLMSTGMPSFINDKEIFIKNHTYFKIQFNQRGQLQ